MQLNEDNEKLECEDKKEYAMKKYTYEIDEKEAIVYDFFKDKKDKSEVNEIGNKINTISEESEISDNKYVKVKNSKLSIGVVFYMEPKDYNKEAKENENIHIPNSASPSPLALIIKKLFEDKYGTEITELVAGHEHGTENKKCHLQTIITFKKNFNKTLNPGAVKINYNGIITRLIYMQQKAKNPFALKNYCKKDLDATLVTGEEYKLFKKEECGKGDPFVYIYENRNTITKEEAKELVIKSDAGLFFRNYNNINNAIEKIVVNLPPVPFSWQPIPEYLKNVFLPNGFNFYDVFNEWYQKYCINGEGLERKKAICLYSEKRSMGKSYFVRHLVSHPDYLLEFNNTICPKKNLGKGIYKLLLLDDMKIMNEGNMAMWKSLVASEPTTLRGAWVNEEYNDRLPCVVTTNDIEMVRIFRDHKLFNTQVIILEISEYMGAPGTFREDLGKYEFYISDKTANKINKLEGRKYFQENNNL